MMNAAPMPQPEVARAFAVADAQAWSAPQFDGIATLAARGRREPDGMREDERRRFAEAEAAGRAAGNAAAQKELNARLAGLDQHARALRAMLDAMARPLSQLDDQIHEQIATLATGIARALVRRELRMDPAQVIGIVRETVALLPASTRGVRVALHPEDAALVRERLVTSGPEAAWSIVDDPVLARGDCRVYTDYAQLDARLETRLNETLALLIGEERARPRGGEEA
jgi:flagellar assembly protein FliH